MYSPAYVLMSVSDTVAAYRRAQGASQQSFCIFYEVLKAVIIMKYFM